MYIEETVYLGRDNTIALKLSSDGITIDHSSITRCQLLVGVTLIDSNVAPLWFDLTQADRLILKLGASSLVVGRYVAKLIIFDAGHSNGLMWGTFSLVVK
jgi:hypothetical protein